MPFWQNGLLLATAVTRGWKGYRRKRHRHRRLTQNKNFVPLLLPGHEPVTFRSRVRRSNHWAVPASMKRIVSVLYYWRLCVQEAPFCYRFYISKEFISSKMVRDRSIPVRQLCLTILTHWFEHYHPFTHKPFLKHKTYPYTNTKQNINTQTSNTKIWNRMIASVLKQDPNTKRFK